MFACVRVCVCVLQVSTLYKDGTIGGNINIVIVGLVLLAEEQVTVSFYVCPVELLLPWHKAQFESGIMNLKFMEMCCLFIC